LYTITLYLESDSLVRRDVPALLTQLQNGFQAAWPKITEMPISERKFSKLGTIF
jgi:hypothetical protein